MLLSKLVIPKNSMLKLFELHDITRTDIKGIESRCFIMLCVATSHAGFTLFLKLFCRYFFNNLSIEN